jgi:hypothetical protein
MTQINLIFDILMPEFAALVSSCTYVYKFECQSCVFSCFGDETVRQHMD